MSTLYIDRSVRDDSRGDWVESLDLDGVDRIVVGTGPGSFAGIRSALAFAQGYALGRPSCEVLGLPSACALAGEGPLAVGGDARRGRFWIALFDGFRMEREVFQVALDGLSSAVPAGHMVTTPDADRIDELLRGLFGSRYVGGRTPTSDGLRRFAEANPAVLRPEPLPLYLSPAVR